jgi:hypothetical protein
MSVDDMTRVKPFTKASNSPAVMHCKRDAFTDYPVSYLRWSAKRRPADNLSLGAARKLISATKAQARPSKTGDKSSSWAITSTGESGQIGKLLGRNGYKAFQGFNPGGAVGVYWLTFKKDVDSKVAIFENQPDEGKKDIPRYTAALEKELIYPHIRWQDAQRWQATPSNYALVPQDAHTRTGLSTGLMRKTYAKCFDYLLAFKEVLLGRTKSIPKEPFYSIIGFSDASLAKFKVVWRQFGEKRIKPSVVAWEKDNHLNRLTPAVCQWTCYFIPFESEDAAHYVCAVVGSEPFNRAVRVLCGEGGKNFASQKQLAKINLPRFDRNNTIHSDLSKLSRHAHQQHRAGELDRVRDTEAQIDATTKKLYGLVED